MALLGYVCSATLRRSEILFSFFTPSSIQQKESPMYKSSLFVVGLLILCQGSVMSAEVEFTVITGAGHSKIAYPYTSTERNTYIVLTPSVVLRFPFNRAFFSSSARTSLAKYTNERYSSLQNSSFSGLGSYNLSDRMVVGLQDDLFVSGRLRIMENLTAENLTDLISRGEYVYNNFSSGLEYRLGEGNLTTSLKYSNIMRDYRYTEENDWTTHVGQLVLSYLLGNKISTQMGLVLTRRIHETQIDYISVPVAASLNQKLGSKFNASLSVGLENRRYNEFQQDRYWTRPTLSLNVTGKFSHKTDSRLLLQRRIYDSDTVAGYALLSTTGDIMLALDMGRTGYLSLHGLYSRNIYLQTKWMYRVLGGHIAISRIFPKIGAIGLDYGYERRSLSVLKDYYRHHRVSLNHIIRF